MSFALITPTRGDRPMFEKQYWNLIKSQTLQPDDVILVDYRPKSEAKDLTARYKKGLELAYENGHEFALLWEDDDWYHKEYIEWLVNKWCVNKKDVFGIQETYYYHIFQKSYLHMNHVGRSSAFCSLVKLPYKGKYPPFDNPFFDIFLFRNENKELINFDNKVLCIGIKHGIGKFGGAGHGTVLHYQPGEKWFLENCYDNVFYHSIRNK